jgi:pullulanase/glycogen debranching enzyme
MAHYEYMKLHLSKISDEIIVEYHLKDLTTPDGWVSIEIRKGMSGLKQAGRLANDRLTKHLFKSGYRPVRHTPSLWAHDTRPIVFALVVDDFGVKYVGKEHAMHLLQAL